MKRTGVLQPLKKKIIFKRFIGLPKVQSCFCREDRQWGATWETFFGQLIVLPSHMVCQKFQGNTEWTRMENFLLMVKGP